MKTTPFEKVLHQLAKEDPRYPVDAYLFLREALDFTFRLMNKPDKGPGRHVSGQELLEGIRQYALREFGPIAGTVLRTWNITRTEDFGELVFNLVDRKLLGKTDRDSKEDFAGGYDFHSAFVSPFLPKQGKGPAPSPGTRSRTTRSRKTPSKSKP